MKGVGGMNNATNTKLTPQEWDELYDKDRETWKCLYLDFMYNRKNITNCENCPENDGYDCNGHKCGQQCCWVAIHTK